METAGSTVGIVQLSAIAFDHQTKEIFDYMDRYINPGDDMAKYWDESSMKVHGIRPNQERIKNAKSLPEVWNEFVKFCEMWTKDYGYEKALMIAWSGKSCDLEHLFIVTEDKYKGELNMPQGLDYFMDPTAVMKHFQSCPLNKKHTKCIGYGLEETWCHLYKKESMCIQCAQQGDYQMCAHDSLADAFAQAQIVLDDKYLPYFDTKVAIQPISELFKKKRETRRLAREELERKVPTGWNTDNKTHWELPRHKRYKGAEGGAEHGPSTAVKEAVGNETGGASVIGSTLMRLFLFFVPICLLEMIAQRSEYYAREEWVKVVSLSKDKDSNDNEQEGQHKVVYKKCAEDDPKRCHRVGAKKKWYKFTPGYILVWLGVLVASAGMDLKNPIRLYHDNGYGVHIPWLQNALIRDAFHQA